ncbi:hypothetical protein Tco_0563954 [Tanacetum coccineum]
MTTPIVTSSTDSQMHNNIMAAGSRDRPPMLATGRYAQWRSRPTTVVVPAVPATENSPAVPEQTTIETVLNMPPANKAHFESEKEAIHLIITRIGMKYTQRLMHSSRNVGSYRKTTTRLLYTTVKSHKSYAPTSKASLPSRYHETTRHKGKEIAKPITPPSESASEEDSDPEQAQKDKDMQKNLALIAKYFQKLYKPTNNNIRPSSNTRNKNCLYLHKVKECDCLAQKLSKQTDFVSKEVYTELLQSFAKLEKHSISLELALQQCQEQMKNDTVYKEKASNVFQKEREQYFKIQDLKAQLQDKNIAISELKKLIEKCKGKFVETKFYKPSVVRQPNAQRIPKPSVLGNPAPFSGRTRDKVMPNTSHVKFKKIEVEEHPRISSISNQTKFVTACNDSLTSRTSNVNVVCATCGKCVFNSNHDACVSKYLNDVNARTKKPKVVPISTRKPKSQANKSVATPHKKTVASESTTQKSKSYYRMLYEKTNKEWKWWIAQQCPSGYKWVPKTKMKWVPKVRNESVPKRVSFAIDNVSRITNIVQLILFIVDSGCTKHMTGNLSLLCNFVEKYLGTVRFGNDQFAPILGYGDLVQGNITINRVYYVEGLNHNLFSVGQFCDADLEVAFRKSTCFVRDLQGNDLLTGNRGSDLYTISLQETTSSTPICLMAKASPTQA